jgi:hypothetical protein
MNFSLEAVPDKLGQYTGMVDMGVGQQHRVNAVRFERQRLVIQFPQGLGALEQAAIDQYARVWGFQPETGARDRTCGPVEGKFDAHSMASRGREIMS